MIFQNIKKDVKLHLRGYGIINSLCPGILPLKLIKSIFDAFVPFINIYASGLVIDALYQKKSLDTLIYLVLITSCAYLGTSAIGGVLNRSIGIKSNFFWIKNNNLITQKINDLDYQSVENPETHNLRQRIFDMQNWSGGGLQQVFWSFDGLIQQFFTIIFSVVLVFKAFSASNIQNISGWSFVNSPVCSVLVIILIMASVIFAMRMNASTQKKGFEIGKGFMLINRVFSYYGQLINNYRMGKDIRMYNQKALIMREGWEDMFSHCDATFSKMRNLETRNSNINSAVSTALNVAIYIFVALRALFGLYSIGSIVQYFGGIQQFIGGFSNFMSTLARANINSEALELLYKFLDLPSEMHKGTIPVEKRDDNEYEIEFKNVSFKYPGTDTYALRNLSMKFTIGQKLAVVGMNGSGKTTMIKLLCRLYDPTEGEILLNNINIKKYDYDEYMRIFSVVFQDFKLFSFPLGQNVAASSEYDAVKAEKCLNMAGFGDRFNSMPKKLDTSLYKDFEEDGVEISGGEAQKIAIARALYKDAPFVVLDEPTAALDPIAEFEIYSRFNDMLAGGKTAIYISHRLSSCRFCNDIAVFHDGELIQRGSHDTLIADSDGKYYELWNAQAQYYAESSKAGVTI